MKRTAKLHHRIARKVKADGTAGNYVSTVYWNGKKRQLTTAVFTNAAAQEFAGLHLRHVRKTDEHFKNIPDDVEVNYVEELAEGWG